MIKRNSLSFRIITRVLLITISLFVFFLSAYYYYSRNLIKNSTRENAIQLAGNLGGKIEQTLLPIEKIPQMISLSIEMGSLGYNSIFPVLKEILKCNENIYGASIAFEPCFFPEERDYYAPYVYREKGEIKTMFLGDANYEYFYMDWYQIPKMIDKPYWSEPYYDEGGGNVLMTTYSVPFYMHSDGERKFAGIATIDLELEWLTNIIKEVQIFETGYAFMISRNGVAITHPDKTKIMNSSIFSVAEEWKAPILREIGRELQQGKSDFREYIIPGAEKRWIYYTNLPSNLWSIGVVYPDAEMFASLKKMNNIIILLIIGGLIALILLIVQSINRLASPLVQFAQSARLIADGNFDVNLPQVKTKDEMKELHNAFSHMQKQLSVYIENLKETTVAKEKIESELRIAHEIQMSMIPHSFPPFPDLQQVRLFAMLKSAKEVGGDLYDFFVMDEDKFCFAIGDVSGKGVPASLFMAVTRTLLRSIADKFFTSKSIIKTLNESLTLNNESCMFVTLFLGIIDIKTGKLSYSNAGHNPPILINQNKEVKQLELYKSIPLGLDGEFIFEEIEIQLMKGDKIFLFTDGVNEAENNLLELFGETRMLEVLKNQKQKNPKELINEMELAINNHVNGYPQSDDITMMTLEYNGE